MAHLVFLLTKKRGRARRHDLVHFLEALTLYLQTGYDLAYGWPETLRALAGELEADLAAELMPGEGEGLSAVLTRLGEAYAEPEHRLWFAVLKELYASGAGLTEAVQAFGGTLRAEHDRDLEAHCRELPTKINVLVLVFFLPPALILLFAPLLIEILGAFS